MKQNITAKQLEELSPKAREKLHQYLGIKVTSALEWPEKYFETALLNIGEMIEFLEENVKYFGIRGHYVDPNVLGGLPNGGTAWDVDGDIREEIEDEICLCDALWIAVKKVLEQK